VINAFAKALEVIPRIIADNAGLDSILILNKLRQTHHSNQEDGKYYGVGVQEESGICNAFEKFIWEPTLVRKNAFSSATEVICRFLLLKKLIKIGKVIFFRHAAPFFRSMRQLEIPKVKNLKPALKCQVACQEWEDCKGI
jgi:hypothetical protein